MKKETVVAGKKNSKPATIKITEDTICIVSFNLPGAFKDRQSNANTKEEIRKMKLSPFLDENKKGRFICSGYGMEGRKLDPKAPLPKNFYLGSKVYNPPTYHTCYERRTYNSESLAYLSSIDARPYNINKKIWDNMSIVNRLEAQFAIDAKSVNPIDPSFTFEFVN